MPEVRRDGEEKMTIDELTDDVWHSLRGNLFRRAVLTRRRCDELVMLSCAEFPNRELSSSGASPNSEKEEEILKRAADRVVARYQSQARGPQEYGFVFLSMILMWAAAAIIQYLVVKWWQRHFDAEAIRARYGWEGP